MASEKKSKSSVPRKMPGGDERPKQHSYLVTFKDEVESAKSAGKGRAAVVQAKTARTTALREKLRQFVQSSGLAPQVQQIGEAMAFPMVSIICTPEAARQLSELPEVDSVLSDGPDLVLIDET
ncbi:MAG: hypothetical protein IT428_12385 [Planctomycetaceae bacterium]|nr:hypothetical protein [Planctomycetaceae bacterium]